MLIGPLCFIYFNFGSVSCSIHNKGDFTTCEIFSSCLFFIYISWKKNSKNSLLVYLPIKVPKRVKIISYCLVLLSEDLHKHTAYILKT